MRIVTAEEMRAIERVAIERCGVSGLDLMERAGGALARAVHAWIAPGGAVLVVCGGGNNGGDGWVAARHLHLSGVPVRAAAVVAPAGLRGDARTAYEAAVAAGVRVEDARDPAGLAARPGDVVVDALLGTGLARPAEGAFAAAIARIAVLRAIGARVVSVDVPSGLSADAGRPLGPCVKADATVTFGLQKRGLVLHPGKELAGEVLLAGIGLPAEALAAIPAGCELLTEEAVRALVPPRPADAHKGDAGRVVVVAGSPGKTGAAHLAVTGALRGGAGLVTLAARAPVLAAALAGRPEAMSVELPGEGPLGLRDLDALLAAAEGVDALVIGPGIPRGEETAALLRALLARARLPVVLDADALNALAASPEGPAGLTAPALLTPHPGEMARLVRTDIASVQADRIDLARRAAGDWGCTVVLKGAGTVVAAPGQVPALVPTGNPGMATGGTGDVLAGLCGGLLAGGLEPFAAGRVAAYLHGAAGDLAAERFGERGLLASDLATEIGAVWARWER